MKFNLSDCTWEPVKGGIHAGGQHAQKNATGIRGTHVPTGTVVVIRGRSLKESKRRAGKELRRRVEEMQEAELALRRKSRRDRAIKDRTVVRTYDYSSGRVVDHRTGKSASLKQILKKGQLDVFRSH